MSLWKHRFEGVVCKWVHWTCCVCLQKDMQFSVHHLSWGAALETLWLCCMHGRGLGLRLSLVHCTRSVVSFCIQGKRSQLVVIFSNFTFACIAWAQKRAGLELYVHRFFSGWCCSAGMTDWMEGLTNLTERGSGSIPFAWREGLATAHILVQCASDSRLSAAKLWVWTSPGYLFLVVFLFE